MPTSTPLLVSFYASFCPAQNSPVLRAFSDPTHMINHPLSCVLMAMRPLFSISVWVSASRQNHELLKGRGQALFFIEHLAERQCMSAVLLFTAALAARLQPAALLALQTQQAWARALRLQSPDAPLPDSPSAGGNLQTEGHFDSFLRPVFCLFHFLKMSPFPIPTLYFCSSLTSTWTSAARASQPAALPPASSGQIHVPLLDENPSAVPFYYSKKPALFNPNPLWPDGWKPAQLTCPCRTPPRTPATLKLHTGRQLLPQACAPATPLSRVPLPLAVPAHTLDLNTGVSLS